jgi:serine/threonine protein kinase
MNEPQATSDTRSDDPRSDDPLLLRAAAAAAAVAVDSPPGSPIEAVALPNLRIGRYRIKRQIGSGGMGVVYEAVHEELGQSAALKLMRFGAATPAALERFVREARVLATCRHANVAQVYDAGVHRHGGQEIAYYVMEYVRGARVITRFASEKQLTIDQRLELFARVCDALHAVHERGVIHRDVKPENVLVDSAGQPKVIDFGVARVTSGDLPVPAHHTRGDSLVGTLQYMSPEQVGPDPGDIDRRSDVYALGLILYELLCGKRPYELDEKTLTEAIRIIREQPPAPPRPINGSIAGDVETVLLTALHKDPDRRYPTAAALAADVRRVLAGEPIEPRRDSASYVLRTRTGALVRRHRVTTVLLAGLLAMVLTEVIGTASNRWLRSDLRYEALAIRFATAPSPPQLRHVKIIEIRSSTDFEALAREMNIPGVSAADRPTLRAAHGRLMQRIAEGDPRSVTWDIGFRKSNPTDELFCEGVQALNDKNCDVVIGGGEWSFDALGLPEMSPAIARLAYWGCTSIGASSDEPCTIHLTMRRGMEEPKQSLALATLAVYRNPKTRPYIAQDSGLAFMRLYPRVFDAASQVFETPPAAQWTRVVRSDVRVCPRMTRRTG